MSLLLIASLLGLISSCKTPANKPNSFPISNGPQAEEPVYEPKYVNNKPAPEPSYVEGIKGSNIRTVMLDQKRVANGLPILGLGSSDQLLLQFDDLDNYLKQYSYRFIHCDANWQPSIMHEGDYLDGFSENYISDYGYSLNTKVPFVHYKIAFPNDQVKLKLSGNYLIQVYLGSDQENIIISKRFYVLDSKVSARMRVKQSTLVSDREEKQEIDFVIQTGDYRIDDPFGGLKVHLRQNMRWDNMITDLQPIFIRNDELDYNHDGPNTFDGNNEYRYVDFRSVRFLGDQIARVDTDGDIDQVILRKDPKRSFTVYSEMNDINGERVINITDGFDSSLEADYVMVHFTLPYAYKIDQPVYVYGALSDWQLKKEFLMTYNEDKEQYEAQVLLKQGYYNYAYAIDNGEAVADETFFEGSHFQTENQYNLFIYNRNAGTRYDQLVGFGSISTRNGF